LLQKDRERIYSEYQQLKKEHDFLKASFERHRIDLSKEPIFSSTMEVSESAIEWWSGFW